ncbi:MAG TPA: hypothetical protein VHV81_06205 [Steroidobacteraceae bacterium]|nr:hypothetical protein [Steroidobacteraceae bacterium]
MAPSTRAPEPDLHADPFAERARRRTRGPLYLLGGRFVFESNDERLLELVDDAYGDLPPQRLPGRAPRYRVRLLALDPAPGRRARGEPAPLVMLSGPSSLGGASAASDAVIVSPRERSALVLVSARTLRSSYHARYELIEFAVFTLASRCRGLVSLHAACIGRAGRGVLLMGSSGAGKSTVTQVALGQGCEFLSEDSVFATPDTLLATGVPNFLHVRGDSLRWLGSRREARMIRASPVIRRRSGVRKFELDLRRSGYRIARAPLRIVAVVFLSAAGTGGAPRLRRLSGRELAARLRGAQAYAAGQAGWNRFERSVARAGAFEIARGRHPLDTVALLEDLLGRAR